MKTNNELENIKKTNEKTLSTKHSQQTPPLLHCDETRIRTLDLSFLYFDKYIRQNTRKKVWFDGETEKFEKLLSLEELLNEEYSTKWSLLDAFGLATSYEKIAFISFDNHDITTSEKFYIKNK